MSVESPKSNPAAFDYQVEQEDCDDEGDDYILALIKLLHSEPEPKLVKPKSIALKKPTKLIY